MFTHGRQFPDTAIACIVHKEAWRMETLLDIGVCP